MLYYYFHVKKNMKKAREAAAELGKLPDVHLHSLNARNRSPLPNDLDTHVNWLAVTSSNREKGHIM